MAAGKQALRIVITLSLHFHSRAARSVRALASVRRLSLGDANVVSVPDANESAATETRLGGVVSRLHPLQPLIPPPPVAVVTALRKEEALSICGRTGSVSQRVAECACVCVQERSRRR